MFTPGKKIHLLLLLLIISQTVFSQSDSVLIKRLNKPFSVSEDVNISLNSQELITSYSIDQTDSINTVLEVWSHYFGDIEPILRVRILSDIYQEQYKVSEHKKYIEEYITKYTDRIYAASEDDYQKIYRNETGYFDYVPLRGNFEDWTVEIAGELLKNQRSGSSEYLLCTLFSNDFDTFDSLLYVKNYRKNDLKKEYLKSQQSTENIIGVKAGYWYPICKLSNYITPSPYFGISAGYPVTESVRVDFAINTAIFKKSEAFDIKDDTITLTAQGKYFMSFEFQLTKEYQIYRDFFLDINSGIGIGFINTDQGYYLTDENGYETYHAYGVSTADFSAGTNFRKKIDDTSSFGINISCHFVPFKLDKKLVNDIGKNFITLLLIYKF